MQNGFEAAGKWLQKSELTAVHSKEEEWRRWAAQRRRANEAGGGGTITAALQNAQVKMRTVKKELLYDE